MPYVLSISNKVFAGKEALSYKAKILDLFFIIPVLFTSSFLSVYVSLSKVKLVLLIVPKLKLLADSSIFLTKFKSSLVVSSVVKSSIL